MSIIVGLKYNNGVVIASDKQATSYDIKYDNVTKIKKTKYSKHCIGSTGYLRDGNILLSIDELMNYKDILDKIEVDSNYMINTIIVNLFNVLRKYNRLIQSDGIEMSKSEFIYCTSKNLYLITCDGGLIENDKYILSGCGSDSVRGYLNTINLNSLLKEEATEILTKAIEKSCIDNIYINKDIDFIYLEENIKKSLELEKEIDILKNKI